MLFNLPRRIALFLIASSPYTHDFTFCFDDNYQIQSLVVEPMNQPTWVKTKDYPENGELHCVTLGGSFEILESTEE